MIQVIDYTCPECGMTVKFFPAHIIEHAGREKHKFEYEDK